MLTAVGGLEDSALSAAGDQLPRRAVGVPDRGVQYFRIRRVDYQIDRAGRIAPEKDLTPGLASIRRLENSALFARTIDMAEGRDIGDVGILGMNAYAPNLAGVAETGEAPGLSRVSRFENAVTVGDVAANRRFSGANLDDVGVRFAHGDAADRPTEIFVGHRRPSHAAVCRLEHTTAGGTEVILHRPRA
jgi:hypothetical protein